MGQSLDEDQVRYRVRDEIEESGLSMSQWALTVGVDRSNLWNFLNSDKPPPAQMLAALGLKAVTYYESGEMG